METGPAFFEETRGAIFFFYVLATATARLLCKVADGLDGTALPKIDLIVESTQSAAMEVCFTLRITLLWLDDFSTGLLVQESVREKIN